MRNSSASLLRGNESGRKNVWRSGATPSNADVELVLATGYRKREVRDVTEKPVATIQVFADGSVMVHEED